jgi:hypothetical protein
MPAPVFTLVLRPLPGIDPVRALRAALKMLLRAYGLRCVRIAAADPLELDPLSERRVANQPCHTPEGGNDG